MANYWHLAGYHVPINAVVNKLLPNLSIDRDRLEDFRLHYAIDRWLIKRNFVNVGSVVVPSHLGDFETLPPDVLPEVSGVLFFFIKGWHVDRLNALEPTDSKEDERSRSSTQVDRNSPMSFPDVALRLKNILTNEGKLEAEEIQWKTVPDCWDIQSPIRPMDTKIKGPLHETMIIRKEPYISSLPIGKDFMTYYKEKLAEKLNKNDIHQPEE